MSEGRRGMAEGNLIAFPELFESAWSFLAYKDKDLSFLLRNSRTLLWSPQCSVSAVDWSRSQKAWSWWFQKKQDKLDYRSKPINDNPAWPTKTGLCSCALAECLFIEEEKGTIEKRGNHVRMWLESSRLATWSDNSGCAEQGGQQLGQGHENIWDTDLEPLYRF